METEVFNFVPIYLESVLINTILQFDLYFFNITKQRFILYRARHTRFTKKNLTGLLDNDVEELYITQSDFSQYNHYLEENLGRIVDTPSLTTEKKANIIYRSARNLMEETMSKKIPAENLERSRNFVNNTVRFILKEKDYFYDIINLTSHDYYTYTHSINVCIYALSVARRVGISSPHQLNLLGTGALLHDIGKSVIPIEILSKKGPLNDAEWEIIKQHPQQGVKLLEKHNELPSSILEIVKCHHEKLDASGYPDGLGGREIPFYAKIVCIADIFDALNTNRPYRDAADTFNSLEIMQVQFRNKIDVDIFKEFIRLFQKK